MIRGVLLAVALALVLCAGGLARPLSAEKNAARPHSLRVAVYDAGYPGAWRHSGRFPYSRYRPVLGFYGSGNARVIRAHLRALRYGGFGAAIVPWWRRRTLNDAHLRLILNVSYRLRSPVRWAIFYQPENGADPGVSTLRAQLRYVNRQLARTPSYLRVKGRFVVFVAAAATDGCEMVSRWSRANTVRAFLVLSAVAAKDRCHKRPDAWYQATPTQSLTIQGRDSVSISPGYFAADEAAPRLARSLSRWRNDIRTMVATNARFKLVTSFNDWGSGTAVEAASTWPSPSGFGSYLDALHTNGREAPAPPPPPATATVLLAAGDIADCSSSGDEATAKILGATAGTVQTLGDNVYTTGSPAQFHSCYQPSWGRFFSRTDPAAGNHEYGTHDAAGYYGYFRYAASRLDGTPSNPCVARCRGYYSYDLGAWHIIVLNSNCHDPGVGGCQGGSAQERWLRSDLASHPAECTLAVWHHPRFSSGQHGNDPRTQSFWQDLYAAHADVILNGHDHDYERFARQSPTGAADLNGIREFIVGTGGKSHYGFTTIRHNSELRNDDTFGILKLTLHATSYDWRFLPEAGKRFTDSGSSNCT